MPLLMSGAFTTFLVLLGLTALALVQHRTRLGSTELAQPTTDAGASTASEAAGPQSIYSLSTDRVQAPGSVGEPAVPDLDEVDHGSDAGVVSTYGAAPPAAPAVPDQPETPVLPQGPASGLIELPSVVPLEPQPGGAGSLRVEPAPPAGQTDSATSATRSVSQTGSAPPALQTQASHRQPADPPRPDQAKGHQNAAPRQAAGHGEHDKGGGAKGGKR